ncbi:MAG: S8 family serine peptidase, partial [Lachnospiraceae bacterium]|nr:S8 family serine peptidase [Lachnospiraceae bacterium]
MTRGIWQIVLTPVRIVSGEYNLYMPSQTVRSLNTHFFVPTVERTLTIPSTATKVITVGAYDAVYNSYAPFSGRGYVNQTDRVLGLTKPDLVAPGVGITAVSE